MTKFNYVLKQLWNGSKHVLRYTIPSRGNVTLQLFNLLGQPVATIAQGELEAGSHHRSITALPAGTYWCRLTAGDVVVVKSVVVQ